MKHRSIAKVVSWILAALLLFTALPNSAFQVRAEGEEPEYTLEVNGKTTLENYANNDPLVVTATGGKWVGVYKSKSKDETPSASQKCFFRFDVDGEPHNIYNTTNGGRTEASFPTPCDIKFVLFGDEGYDNILATVKAHINGVTENSSVLEVAEKFEKGDPVPITARSENRDASVGIYRGTYSCPAGDTETFADKTPVERFYLSQVDNQGKTIEGLSAGKYTAVLFQFNNKSGTAAAANVVDLVANFEVVGSLTTDKDSYNWGEPINVTSTTGSWVGLYKADETPAPNVAYNWCDAGGTYNLLEEHPKGRTDWTTGDYAIHLFADGGFDNIMETKIVHITGPFDTDKDTYELNEPIMVTTNYSATSSSWYGLYKKNEAHDGTVTSIYWYYPTQKEENPFNILNGTGGDTSKYGDGEFTVVLFSTDSSAPYTIVAEKDITIGAPEPPKEYFTTDKDVYDYDEPIMVTTDYDAPGSWIGLYKKGEMPSSSTPSVYWYYLNEKPNPTDIIDKDSRTGNVGNYWPGEFTLYLVGADAYSPIVASKDIMINAPTGEQVLTVDGPSKVYKWGQDINVTAKSPYTRTAWVGLYPYLKEDGSNVHVADDLMYSYNVRDEEETINFLKFVSYGTGEKPLLINEIQGLTDKGKYKFILYQHDYDIPTATITSFTILRTYDDENIVWDWAEDNSTATATFKALDDETKTKVLNATVTSEVIEAATCDTAGLTKYTATVTADFATVTGELNADGVPVAKTYTVVKEVVTPATGHAWSEPEYTWNREKVVTGYLWEETTWEAITPDDVIAITMSKDGKTFILTSENGNNNPPPATEVTLESDGKSFKTSEVEKRGWIREGTEEGSYQLRANNANEPKQYLHTPTGSGQAKSMRVGETNNDLFIIGIGKPNDEEGYYPTLSTAPGAETAATRYFGVFINNKNEPQDWRSYDPFQNIGGETLQIWKLSGPIEEEAEDGDYVSVTATRACTTDPGHIETETVGVTHTVTEPTCTEAGADTWTSEAFQNEAFAVQTKTTELPALGHDWGEWTHVEDSDPSQHTRSCKNGDHPETENCVFVDTKNEDGTTTRTCSICGYSYTTIDPTITTNKDVYALNEPILVTAYCDLEGSWVGLYEKDEDPATAPSSFAWYSTNNGEHDILSEPHKRLVIGGRYKVILFGDDGYTNILAQKEIRIVSDTTLATDKTAYKWGEDIIVTANSPYPDAWVGLYHYLREDGTDVDLPTEYLAYYSLKNLEDPTKPVNLLDYAAYGEILSVGKYKVIIFTDGGFNIDIDADEHYLIKPFEILRAYDDENIVWTWSDDKTSATATFTALDDENEKQTVTATVTEEVISAATCETAGQKKVTATVTVEFLTKTGETTFTTEETVAIPALGHAYGEWTHDEGSEPSTHSRTCANDPTHKETENCTFGDDNKCTVCGFEKAPEVTGTLTTDKTSYEMGEPIMVYATCDGDKAWVGLYKKGEVPETNLSIYWYYLEGEENYTNILATDGSNGRTGEFGPGEYTIYLIGSGGYEPIVATVDITVTGGSSGPVEDKLETDKTEYAVDDPIMVTAACSGYEAWVGLYKEGETQDPDQGGSYSIYWFWVNKKSDPQVSTYPVQLNQDAYDQNGRAGEFGPGKYVLILFGDGYYSDIRIRKEITILGDETPAAKIALKINDVEQTADYQENKFQVGTEMSITATTEKDGDPGNAWVGFYQGRLSKESNFKDASTEWYYVKDYDGTPFKLTKADFSVAGDYTVVLFGNGNYNQIRLLVYFSIKPEIAKEEVVEKPTCEKAGKKMIVYVDGTHEYETIPALGHDYGDWVFDEETHTHSKTCKRDKAHVILEDCTFELVSDEAGLKTYKCKVCGGTYTEGVAGVTRVYGQNRYETSLKVAEEMKKSLGVEKFDNVILTTGENFADALGGGYLASAMKAPILLTKKNSSMKQAKAANDFITANLKDGGTIYVLGGTTAVPNECLEGLDTKKFKVVRLEGKSRYDTNLRILEAAGVKAGDDILVCTGTNFADSLAASSAGKAILLVGKKLTAKQKELLSSLKGSKMYILGGPKAVSEDVEKELKGYGTTERLSGSNRYTTMALIAKTFYPKATSAALVYSENFPDGLCAGPLANINGMPLLLVKEGKEKQAMDFCVSLGIKTGYILGGPKLIPDDSAVKIFSLKDANEIK